MRSFIRNTIRCTLRSRTYEPAAIERRPRRRLEFARLSKLWFEMCSVLSALRRSASTSPLPDCFPAAGRLIEVEMTRFS